MKQLQAWVERKDWSTILPAFARCVRITRSLKEQFKVKEKVFAEPEEKNLFAALQKAETAPRLEGSVDDFLQAFIPMIPAVNAFFDKVLVMAEDETIRQNRLALVGEIANLSSGIADLSKLEGF